MSPTLAAAASTVPQPETHRWTLLQKFGFRFAFIYLTIYCVPSTLFDDLPGVDKAIEFLDRGAVLWFASHVLHLPPITIFPNGSGDTTYNYVQVAVYTLVALAGAVVWSALDRHRPHHEKLHEALRILVRYVLGGTLFSYGIVKVFKSQFPMPDLDGLMQTYGQSSPMRLLWTFMGASTAYTMFTGFAEILSGLLLYFRRTTMLGALLGGAVMANVVMMNFSYDVPVKLYSSHLLLMSIFLLLPDLRRLTDFLILRRAVEPAQVAWPWPKIRWMKIARWVAKPAYIGLWLYFSTSHAISAWKDWGDRAPTPPLYGVWDAQAGSTWQRLYVNRHHNVVFDLADRSRERFVFTDDGHGTLTLDRAGQKYPLKYRRPDADHLELQGTLLGRPLDCRLTKQAIGNDFLLIKRGFHWVNEYPLNR